MEKLKVEVVDTLGGLIDWVLAIRSQDAKLVKECTPVGISLRDAQATLEELQKDTHLMFELIRSLKALVEYYRTLEQTRVTAPAALEEAIRMLELVTHTDPNETAHVE